MACLLSDNKFAATSYLCARELGIKALKQTSSLAIKDTTQVGKSEFSMDLKADKQLNAIEATQKNQQVEELKRNLEDITKKSVGKDTPSEVQRGAEKTTTTSDQRKRKPTQLPSKDDGKKRRLSTERSPPDANKPLSKDEDLPGEEEDKTSKGKRSHHKKKACSVAGCKFFGSDLKRHLKLHVRKGEIAEDSIKQLATIMTTGKKNNGASQRCNTRVEKENLADLKNGAQSKTAPASS